jgi:hypothetical protein
MAKKEQANPSPKKPAKVDPEILKIRKKYAAEVKAYMRTRESSAILKTIIEKRVPKLCELDRQKLLDHLMTVTTPPLKNLWDPQPQNPVLKSCKENDGQNTSATNETTE